MKVTRATLSIFYLTLLSFWIETFSFCNSLSPVLKRNDFQAHKKGSTLQSGLQMMIWGNKSGVAKVGPKESELFEVLASTSVQGRGKGIDEETLAKIQGIVTDLEKKGGLKDPADNPVVNGRWRLLFTTTPGTASPIQRSFVGIDSFAVYQDIDLESESPVVANVVDFGEKVGVLTVAALASTYSKPLPGFKPRQGDGRILGLNIFGVSSTEPPANPKQRIDFKFDDASFDFAFLPFKIPYPVPFRYLGDEVTGWIDITYMSSTLRIARGNKGTLFILKKQKS